MKVSHKEIDSGYAEINRQIRLIAEHNPIVEVGVLEGSGDAKTPDGKPSMTLASLATIHEYGSPANHIPQRSFIGSTMDESAPQFHEATNKLIDRIIEGKQTVASSLTILGLLITKSIKAKIQSNIAPALSPATIRRKSKKGGPSTALIDTGQLVNSINFLVKLEGDGTAGSGDIQLRGNDV